MEFENMAWDIIIQAGQSNAEGCAHTNKKPADITDERVVVMERDFSMHTAALRRNGDEWWSDFSISFARDYIDHGELDDGRGVLVLRSAVGGTGFGDHRWGMTDDLYLRMMEMIRRALAMNPENRLVGFIWHQGETDVGENTPQADYIKYLTALLESVRGEFCCPALPFVAGDFVQQWSRANPSAVRIVDGLRSVCRDAGNAAFVETDGLTSNDEETGNGDTIHFGYIGINRLGRRYYKAFCAARK